MARRVLITGAGSGLGAAMARLCAARGDRVAVVDIRQDRAEETVAALEPIEGGHLALAADVGSEASMEALRDTVEHKWGGLELLVNNAGVASGGEIVAVTPAEWDRVMNINLMGVVRGCRLFLPLLLRQKGSLVINTASFAGLAGAPTLGAYGVSKAAVVALSETLNGEMKAHGGSCSVLCPSFFQTNLLESCAPGQDEVRHFAGRLMRKSALSADDVARYAVEQAERGRFMLLPHPETRRQWWLKRWFPNRYYRSVQRYFEHLKQRAGHKPG
jgi:NAD(P)-dependent dehydrogenase (short-subunit alcohol dehydrogenase family)